VEFDSHPNPKVDDPPWQHISVHAAGASSQPVSANETASIGSSPPWLQQLTLSDATSHHARIEYRRGSGSSPGWMTVWTYRNSSPSTAPERWEPILNAFIPAANLGSLANPMAFVGFTAASGEPGTLETVDISNWAVQTAAPSPATSSLTLAPASVVGQPRQEALQLRDACGAPFPLSSPSVTLLVTGPVDPGTGAPVSIPMRAQDNLDGTYTLSYTPRVAGAYQVFAGLAGKDLSGTPYTVNVVSPRTDP
jgi:Filamin/ABP280 repeat/Legume lectin domain